MNKRALIGVGLLLAFAVALTMILRKRMASQFQWPVKGRITSPFGERTHPVTGAVAGHNGIDIAAPIGTDVLAAADGVVGSVYSTATGGKQVVVVHDNGWKSGYAHLSEQLVRTGDHVAQGQVIAKSGNTGQVTGPHLHFTMTDNSGSKVDPIKYLA